MPLDSPPPAGAPPLAPVGPAPPARRIAALDAVRGLAILGMVAFHLDWDLADLGFIATSPAGSPAWTAFGHAVAATFLLLSGMGLVLGRARGLGHALRRIGRIAACAVVVTAATWWLFPAQAITFGILHCIAATNLIALAILDAPIGLILAAAGASLAAPLVMTTGATEGPPWWWLGISRSLPNTLDYRPVLPWLGVVLLGLVLARISPDRLRRRAGSPRLGGLAFAGRHSLVIYLLHQPLLYGLLSGLAILAPPDRTAGFLASCQTQCVTAGAGPEGCRVACACVSAKLPVDAATNSFKQRLDRLSRACLSQSAPAADPAGESP